MSVERQDGIVIFECDNCGEELDTDETEFVDALDVLREEGWKAFKVSGDWVHHCGDCRGGGT